MDGLVPILGILGIFIIPALALGWIGVVYFRGRHEETMAMIDKGVVLKRQSSAVNRFRALCNGLLMVGLALGLLCAVLLDPHFEYSFWLYPALVVLGGGLGFLVYFFVAGRMMKDEETSKETFLTLEGENERS